MDDSSNKGLSATDTELTVRVNTEINALVLRQLMLLDGCVFAREKSLILSARAPPCRILKFRTQNSKFKTRRNTMKEKVTREENTIGRFTNWLDTLARRAKYEYIENESKHISHACIDEVPEDALRADEIEISYTVSAVERKFEFEAEWLMKAFAELTQTHQRILELLYVEEKTPQEAAAILGCKVDNIYNQQYRAFRIIKRIRKEGMTDETVE